jgi:hypothetical protein
VHGARASPPPWIELEDACVRADQPVFKLFTSATEMRWFVVLLTDARTNTLCLQEFRVDAPDAVVFAGPRAALAPVDHALSVLMLPAALDVDTRVTVARTSKNYCAIRFDALALPESLAFEVVCSSASLPPCGQAGATAVAPSAEAVDAERARELVPALLSTIDEYLDLLGADAGMCSRAWVARERAKLQMHRRMWAETATEAAA